MFKMNLHCGFVRLLAISKLITQCFQFWWNNNDVRFWLSVTIVLLNYYTQNWLNWKIDSKRKEATHKRSRHHLKNGKAFESSQNVHYRFAFPLNDWWYVGNHNRLTQNPAHLIDTLRKPSLIIYNICHRCSLIEISLKLCFPLCHLLKCPHFESHSSERDFKPSNNNKKKFHRISN